jgi:hypothetical protein
MRDSRRRAVFLVAIVGGLWSTEAAGQRPVNSFQDCLPPDLVGRQEHWVHPPAARTLKGLRGRPVWLQFNF